MLIPTMVGILKSTCRHSTIKQMNLNRGALSESKDRKKWCSSCNLKERHPEILCRAELSFKNEGVRKTFSNLGKLK